MEKLKEEKNVKKLIAWLLVLVCVAAAAAALGEEGPKFITIREWLDAKGDCGECMLAVRVLQAINPVLAIVQDETGTVNLFSGTGPDTYIINFLGTDDYSNLEDYVLVIKNPKWNEYEGSIEMAAWEVLRMLPPASV